MPLVRKQQQLGGHLLDLQSREQLQSLSVRHPEVEFTMNYESWGFEFLHIGTRRPLDVGIALLPGSTAELPEGEPEFLRSAEFAGEVVYARVGDQRLEALRVAANPVDHVTPVGRACGSHAAG